MNIDINGLVKAILKKQSLDDCSYQELLQATRGYPYFSGFHLLLAKKIEFKNDESSEKQFQKTSLYFQNPLWLQHLMKENGNALIESRESEINQHEPVAELVHIEEKISSGSVPAFHRESDNVSSISSADLAEDGDIKTLNGNKIAEITQDESKNPSGESVDTEFGAIVESETAMDTPVPEEEVLHEATEPSLLNESMNQTEITAGELEVSKEDTEFLAEPESRIQPDTPLSDLEAIVLENESPEIADSMIQPEKSENGFKAIVEENKPPELPESLIQTEPVEVNETMLPGAVDTEGSNEATGPDIEPPVMNTTEDFPDEPFESGEKLPVGEKEDRDFSSLLARNLRLTPADLSTNEISFEPFHTVDYFASQGIQFRDEEKPADKLGQQLKSFTEWLKTLKKVTPNEIASQSTFQSELKVEQLAEHSLTDREVVTETMAEVWEKQGNRARAIDTYHKLSLLNPSKSSYFAAKIEQLKQS